MAQINLAINGRFTTQVTSGVQRFAHNMSAALADIAREKPALLSVELFVPARADMVSPPAYGIPVRRAGVLTGHAWEQLELPLLRGRRTLFSPCNTGAAIVRNQIVTMHDAQVYLTPETYSWAFRTWYRLLLPTLGRRARLITTDSQFSLDALRKFGVLAPSKGSVVYAGADHVSSIKRDDNIFARAGIVGKPYLLAIGSLSPHKNIRTIIEAIELAHASLPLVVAGGGNRAIFANAGLSNSNKVRFLGRVADAELRALYERAEALLFPSYFEGFGLPPLEAMQFDCPVIASTGGSIPEVCGPAALYADPGDVAAWARAIDDLIDNPHHADKLRELGRAQAARFTWRANAERLVSLLLEGGGAKNARG